MRRLYHALERMSTKTTMQHRRKTAIGGVRKKSLIMGKIITDVKIVCAGFTMRESA